MTDPSTVAKPTSGLAVASLILGILACLTFTLIISVLFAIGAIICGHLSSTAIKEQVRNGRGLMIAGLILGYIYVGGFLLALAIDPARLG